MSLLYLNQLLRYDDGNVPSRAADHDYRHPMPLAQKSYIQIVSFQMVIYQQPQYAYKECGMLVSWPSLMAYRSP